MNRLHVHLSKDITTASMVGSRHGRLVVMKIDTDKVSSDFFLSENGVWLTDSVPVDAIEII